MELIIDFFPSTFSGWVIQILGSLVASYFLLSLAEYLFHRFLMHQGLPQIVYTHTPFLGSLLYDHRKLHHEKYYHQFDYEPDPYGRNVNLRLGWEHTLMGVLFFLPYFLLTTWLISFIPTIVFCICASIHNVVWNTIHTEMHQPRHPSWTRWWTYKLLARRHYRHHLNTRLNFNIVCPFIDIIVKTESKAVQRDGEALTRLGFK